MSEGREPAARPGRAKMRRVYRRRRLVALALAAAIGVGAWALVSLAGGGSGEAAPAKTAAEPPATTARLTTSGPATIPAAEPGTAVLITQGPAVQRVALTFDDGSCAECIRAILKTLERTRTPATIFPNGVYKENWEENLTRLRRLIDAGLVDVGNHTWAHVDATKQTPAQLTRDINRVERWIEGSFDVTTRPLFRPPFGQYDDSVLETAGKLGYTQVVNWSDGSLDWETQVPEEIVGHVRDALEPGVIVLMHANRPGTAEALPLIVELLARQGYEPVTLRALLASG